MAGPAGARRRAIPGSVLLLLIVAGCSSGGPAATEPAGAGPTTGPTTAAASAAPDDGGTTISPCTKFTTAEIAAAVGRPVQDSVAESGPGICEWPAVDGSGSVYIGNLTGALYAAAAAAPGYRTVAGIGEQAFVGPSDLGGTQAGALVGDAFDNVLVTFGPPPSEDAVIALLRTWVARANG
jgi:hypothetical protein